MSMEKQKRLVDRLLTMTLTGQLGWKAAERDKTFEVSFEAGRLSVGAVSPSQLSIPDYEISLYKADRTEVETFTDSDLYEDERASGPNAWRKKMHDLHEYARRTALGAEEILNSILNEIEASNVVRLGPGGEQPPK